MTPDKKKTTENGRKPGRIEEEAFVSLLRTGDLLARRLEGVLKAAEVSPTQYNVLRILRGAPEGLACGEIGNRMISRDPDITRLLDRLEKRKLISRSRETKDRRMVLARITDDGMKVLADLDGPVLDTHCKLLGHMGKEKLQSLLGLLAEARRDRS
jgi:DNA-binding MarR family transcriptional regulator